MAKANLLLDWFSNAEAKLRQPGWSWQIQKSTSPSSAIGINFRSESLVGTIAHWPPDLFEFQFNSCETGDVVFLETGRFNDSIQLGEFLDEVMELLPNEVSGISRRVGDIVEICPGDDWRSYARVLREPLLAFYDLKSKKGVAIEEVVEKPILWRLMVMNYAVTSGRWRVIGNRPLEKDFELEPTFFKVDPISKQVSLYRNAEEWPATREECHGLERAAVWDPEHVEERLLDHFAGRSNRWVKEMSLEADLDNRRGSR